VDPAASNLRRADQAPAPRQILANPSAKVKPRAHITTAKCPPAIGSPKVKPYSQPIPPGRLCNTVIPHTHRGATAAAWWWWFSLSHLHHPKSCVAETSLVPFIQKFIHSSEPFHCPTKQTLQVHSGVVSHLHVPMRFSSILISRLFRGGGRKLLIRTDTKMIRSALLQLCP